MNIDAKTTMPATFSEKLLPSFYGFVAAAIALPSCYLVILPINELAGLIIGVGLTAALWLVMFLTSAKITVQNGELNVGAAHISVEYLADGREIEANARFAERGPGLDARAFVRFQAGVKPLVRLENLDANDYVPYWLIATRKPTELLAAIEAAKRI
jgi:hypothetical protein